MKSRKKLVAAAVVAGSVLACAPAAAPGAVTASVTGDDGAPAALSTTTPLGIRNIDVRAYVHVDAADAGSYQWQVADQNGTGATTPSYCWRTTTLPDDSAYVTYHGNMSYTLTLKLYSDANCATATSTQAYTWNVGATVSLGQPAGALLTRQANSFSTITQQLDFAGTPGASTYEIKYAKGGVVGPDGSISSPALSDAFLNRATGKVEVIGAREPGDYVIVARAKSGDYYTPWSAPVTMKLIAPFDFSSRTFPDARGPRYQVRGVLGETTAGGRVTVAIAKGKTGRRFRTLGKAKVDGKGVFKLRFAVRGRGTYRLRYSFAGTAAVRRGTVYEVVRIRRTLG